MLMLELLRRSRESESLTDGIAAFIEAAFQSYPDFERYQRYNLNFSTDPPPLSRSL